VKVPSVSNRSGYWTQDGKVCVVRQHQVALISIRKPATEAHADSSFVDPVHAKDCRLLFLSLCPFGPLPTGKTSGKCEAKFLFK
jgi:hypothetical protein